MNLPPRLEVTASFVPPCECLADIGTDHAYIPIHLIEKGVIKRAVASDIAAGPAKIALRNIKRHGLEDRISVVTGYGLEPIDCADVIVIAGMGGKVICDILTAGEKVARSARLVVIQPMTMVMDVRRFLSEKGFAITDEAIAKEGQKLYNIMAVRTGEEIIEDDIYFYVGKRLVEKKDPLLGEYIGKRIAALDISIDNMGNSVGELEKREQFISLKKQLLEVLDDYRS
ncbi:MAG: tRNA (adenine(22)-N(1))-methyltransferase [Firmicutes bacterium ADurb.Bin193]|nr:MAG: tRNA (adenine(22)-N(1))-methyltransferase [Firmicutes bacterium ADurb.Bin193]